MSNNIFNIGVSGLNAAQWGLTVTGQNISNAATAGYTQEKVEYQEASGQYTNSGYLGTGVQTATVTRSYSQYLSNQLSSAQSSSGASNTYYTLIAELNNLVGDPTTGIASGVSNYFTGLQSVANNPNATSSRQTLMSSAQTLADQITTAGSQYDQLRQNVNTQLTSAVTQINSYSKQISDLNKQINQASAAGQPPNQLLDQRDLAVQNLSAMVDVTVSQSDGNYNVFIGNGQPLVVGNKPYSLQAVTSPTDPSELTVAFQSSDGSTLAPKDMQYVPDSALTGGTVGGLLSFRSQTLDPGAAQLGAIATSFSAQLNAQNALGLDLSGKAGGDLFKVATPTVYSDVRNTGTGGVSAAFTDPTQPTTGDYTLSYDGSKYTMTDTASGNVMGTIPNPSAGVAPTSGTINGLQFTFSGAVKAGDSFSVQPTRGALDNFALSNSNPSAIAAATPVLTTATNGNTGSGAISAGTVAPGYSSGSGMTLTYSASGKLTSDVDVTLADSTVVPAGTPFAYDSTKGITVTSSGADPASHGVTTTITGSPVVGDSFKVTPNTSGTADGSNALAMAQMVSSKSMNGGTDTLTSSYANYVNTIGNQTNQLKSTSTSQTALLAQVTAAQQAVSGVNLNEEAANLMQYQQLYQANSKVIQTASSLFQTLLGIFN